MQSSVNICDVDIPVIVEDDVKYYPVSYMGNKVLHRQLKYPDIKDRGYNQYCKKYFIKFDENNIQESWCISEEGFKRLLTNTKVNKLRNNKQAMQNVCDYFGLVIEIDLNEKFISKYEDWIKYDFWIKECIESLLETEPVENWQRCGKCGQYLPYHENFFDEELNPKNNNELKTVCRGCRTWNNNRGKDYIKHNNKELNRIYERYGRDIYLLYKSKDIIKIWEWWIDSGDKHIPEILRDKDGLLFLLKCLYSEGKLKENEFSFSNIYKKIHIQVSRFDVTLKDIYKKLLDVELQSKEGHGVDNFEDAKIILLKYIKNNKVKIKDIFDFNYYELIRNVGLTGFLQYYCNNDLLEFITKFHENKYPPYRFSGGYKKYWEEKENRDNALKWLIEKDLKIPIEKIPLYLTLTSIRNIGTTTMYDVLKKYYKGIYEWVNEVYPGKFIELDFNINAMRNEFDSQEEKMIHDVLKDNLKNVIYNTRNTENTVKINGMIPDWYCITDNGFYIIEYFGITNNQKNYNIRISDYKNKANEKISKYENINWIKKIYLYPEDMKNNFKGVKEKIKIIV